MAAVAGRRYAARFYADWEVLPHEDKLPHADALSERLETLQALADGAAPVITVTPAALMQCTLPPAEIAHRSRTLQLGDRLEPIGFHRMAGGTGLRAGSAGKFAR